MVEYLFGSIFGAATGIAINCVIEDKPKFENFAISIFLGAILGGMLAGIGYPEKPQTINLQEDQFNVSRVMI